jgi:H+/gluconate symporter-like permease
VSPAVGAFPAFVAVHDAVLSIQRGPLISLTVAMNVLAGLTGTAAGGMAIALNALGDNFMALARELWHQPRADAPHHHVAILMLGSVFGSL